MPRIYCLCWLLLLAPGLAIAEMPERPRRFTAYPTTFTAPGLFDSMFRSVAPGRMSGPRGRPPFVLDLRGGLGDTRADRTDDDLTTEPRRFSASLNIPVPPLGGGRWITRLNLGYSRTEVPWEFRDNDTPYPDVFEESEFGVFLLHFLAEKWTLNFGGSLKTLDGGADFGDSFVGTVNAFAAYQIDDRSALRFGLNIATTRPSLPQLDFVPFPTVAYIRRITNRFSIAVGAPFAALQWQPLDPLQVRLQYVPADNWEGVISYRPADPLEFALRIRRDSAASFVDYDIGPNEGDRLETSSDIASFEVYLTPGRWATLGLQANYRFNEGSFVVNEDDDDRDEAIDRRDFENGWEGAFSLILRL